MVIFLCIFLEPQRGYRMERCPASQGDTAPEGERGVRSGHREHD